MGRFVLAFVLGLGGVAATGCDSSSSSDEDANGATAKSEDDECRIKTRLSGGVAASFGDVDQVCVYTSRSVGFAPLGGGAAMLLTVRSIAAEQTGSFPATVEVNVDRQRWVATDCTVEIESNVKVAAKSDAGDSFDRYGLKGHGSCSAAATFTGSDGAPDPVTVAPFTFTANMLFY